MSNEMKGRVIKKETRVERQAREERERSQERGNDKRFRGEKGLTCI
ncbi:MAG: hypothetical protein KAS01_01185 [Candidatus Pacebacteria bacterium]|nr:hypothetical protein [Candidatus Paceibacterota bacterium]